MVDFSKEHEFFLEREPTNKYDNRAIKLGVYQDEKNLDIHGQELLENSEVSMMKIYLGYVPKDLSFNLSVLLDNP